MVRGECVYRGYRGANSSVPVSGPISVLEGGGGGIPPTRYGSLEYDRQHKRMSELSSCCYNGAGSVEEEERSGHKKAR